MSHGGARKGAGRPKGSRNNKTVELVEKALGDGESPLEYLIRIMRDDTIEDGRRDDAAKAAAPYVHAKLSSVDVEALLSGDIDHNHSADPETVRRVVDEVKGIVGAIARSGKDMGEGAVQE